MIILEIPTYLSNLGIVITVAAILGIMWKTFEKAFEVNKTIARSKSSAATLATLSTDTNKALENISIKIDTLTKEFKPNGGTSLKDSVNRLEKAAISIEDKLYKLAMEAKYNKIANKHIINTSTNSGYWISDKEGKTIEAGIGLCRLLNRTEEELKDLKWSNYVHPEDRDRVVKQLRYIVENGGTFNEDYRISILSSDHNKVYINVNAFAQPIEMNGAIEGFYGVMTQLD